MNTEIAEYIKNHIREYLPPEYQEAHITLEEVTKGNDRRLTGLMIRNDGEITVPTIYLEPYAKQLAQGRPMDEIIREIVQIRTEQDTRVPFEVSDLMDYRQVKPMLAIRLCDPEQNREYLKDKPFTPCGELAAVYRIQVMESKEGVASAVVTDRMMELWGVTKEQLHQDAVAAETERSPVCFYSMEDMMDEIMFSSKPENLFECTEPLDAATVLPIRQISPVRRQSNRPLPITTGITASERRQYIRFWNNSVMTGCFMCLRARSGKRIGMGVFPAITKPGRKPFRSTRTRTASAKIGMFTLWWIVATPDLSISFLRRPGSIIQRNMGRKSRSAKA